MTHVKKELERGNLCSGILHGHSVRSQEQVRLPSLYLLVLGVVQVAIHHLLRQGQRSLQSRGLR